MLPQEEVQYHTNFVQHIQQSNSEDYQFLKFDDVLYKHHFFECLMLHHIQIVFYEYQNNKFQPFFVQILKFGLKT